MYKEKNAFKGQHILHMDTLHNI